MNELKNIMWMYALSPVHAGSGDDLNYIDMPIQRERHTKLPNFEASSIKGAVRHAMEDGKNEGVKNKVKLILGKEEDSKNDGYATAVVMSDARLLFFPVKSAKGIFAWVTCPMIIRRFLQDCQTMGMPMEFKDDQLKVEGSKALVADPKNSELCFKTGAKNNKIMLEEFVFDCGAEKDVKDVNDVNDFKNFLKNVERGLPEESFLKERLFTHVAMIGDDDFEYFVTHSTEVVTRIRIDSDSRTAKGQALFTEEYLPSESLLYSMLIFLESKSAQGQPRDAQQPEAVKNLFDELLPQSRIVQIGGDMTLGKGLVKIKIWDDPKKGDSE